MKLGDYPILAVQPKSYGCQLVWRNEYSVVQGFFDKEQTQNLIKQARVETAEELRGHTIVVIKIGNGHAIGDTQYVCLPKGASFQAEVKITIVEGDGAMIEAQAV